MEHNKYLKYANELYKNITLYSELQDLINKKINEYKDAPIEGNQLYIKNHKNALKLEIEEVLVNKKNIIIKKAKIIETKYKNALYEKYKKKYKNTNILNENDLIYKEYNRVKNELNNNVEESIDEIISNNSITKNSKLYNEIILECIKKIIERKDVEDINEIYYPDYNNPNFSSNISKRSEFLINIPKKDKSCKIASNNFR